MVPMKEALRGVALHWILIGGERSVRTHGHSVIQYLICHEGTSRLGSQSPGFLRDKVLFTDYYHYIL